MKFRIIASGFLMGVMVSFAQEKKEVTPTVNQVVYEVFSLDRALAAASQREAITDAELYAQMLKN